MTENVLGKGIATVLIAVAVILIAVFIMIIIYVDDHELSKSISKIILYIMAIDTSLAAGLFIAGLRRSIKSGLYAFLLLALVWGLTPILISKGVSVDTLKAISLAGLLIYFITRSMKTKEK